MDWKHVRKCTRLLIGRKLVRIQPSSQSGSSSVWSEFSVWIREVAGSNPASQTNAPEAQLDVQAASNGKVVGSSPTRGTS